MPSFKDTLLEQDIPFGDNQVAKAGTPIHNALVKIMVKEAEAKHAETLGGYSSSVKNFIDGIEGLADDEFVEAFVAVKNGNGFDVTPVDNKDKIVVKSRLRKSSTKDKQTTAEKK